MKRILIALLAMGLLVAGITGCGQDNVVAPMDALSTFSVTTVNGEDNSSCTDLLAGQTIVSGDVCFEVVGTTLNVTYTTTGGWELTEAHLWVGCDPDGYPQTKKGNPKIGNFPHNSGDITGASTHTFSVDLAQFPCLASIDCETGNLLYVMAHAAVRKDNGDGTYQTETGWADGDPSGGRSWATVATITMLDDSCGGGSGEDKCYDHETAFAYGGADATCFLGADFDGDGFDDGFNRWGWSNGPLSAGTYIWDVYAGAGQCDLSKGTLVGTATLIYDSEAGSATVTYNLNLALGWIFETTHAYVGSDPLPTDNGEFTVAPGQFGSTNDLDPADRETTSTHTFTGLSGEIYAVIHAAVLLEKPCEITPGI